jgi:disulfide bond formation protein DsbB
MKIAQDTPRALNAIGLILVSLILYAAFYEQIALSELPCPLCLLQRAGFAVVGAALALNILIGPRPGHYALMLGGAVIGGSVSLRQIALHIVPGTGAYGSPIFGLHLYTWAFVIFGVVVIGTAFMLLYERQFSSARETMGARKGLGILGGVSVALFALAVFANGVSTILECGAGLCPDNPVTYETIDDVERALQ